MPMDEHLYSPSARLKELSTFANSVEMMFYTHTRPWQATYITIGPIKGAYGDSSAATLTPFRGIAEGVGLKGSKAMK